MVMDHEIFFQDPYRQAQRALMLADTLIAAHQISEPQNSDGSPLSECSDQVSIKIGVRAAQAEFGLRHLSSLEPARGQSRRH